MDQLDQRQEWVKMPEWAIANPLENVKLLCHPVFLFFRAKIYIYMCVCVCVELQSVRHGVTTRRK